MSARGIRNAQVLCAILGWGLGLTAAAAGQSGMIQRPDGTSQTAPMPEQQAWFEQVEQLNAAAAQALDAGRYDEAVTTARRAIDLDEANCVAPHILALALEDQGRMPEALAAYQALADRGSSQPGDLLPYALLLLHQGQWVKALAAYEKALPYVANGDLLRANSAFSPTTPDPAALEVAIHLARGLTFNSGLSIVRHPEKEKAMAEFQHALALAPNSDLVNYYYGFGLQQTGQNAQAQAAFTKAIKLAHGGVKIAAEQALEKLKQKKTA